MMFGSRKRSSRTDSDLLALFKETGDLEHLGDLYQRYASMVLGVCLKYLRNREESKDAVMQIFEKLVTALRVHEVSNFKSWLYSTTRNYCLMQLRARKSHSTEEIGTFIMETNGEMHQEEGQELEWNLVRLEKCLEMLGQEQKQCVELFYLKQKCYQEITEMTGYNFKQVKSYIQNGKRNLKICLDNNG